MKFRPVLVIAAVLGMLVLSACRNPWIEKAQKSWNEEPEVPDVTYTVNFDTGGSAIAGQK